MDKIAAMTENMKDKSTPAGRMRLSEMKQGEEAIIIDFEAGENNFHRLKDMGLLSGTPVRLIRFAPLGDPLEIKARGCYLSLRKSTAEQIWVIRKEG